MRSEQKTKSGLATWTKPGVVREPLMLLSEMADEFGLSVKSLGRKLAAHDGPRPHLASANPSVGKKSYYKPSEMRKWWKEVGSA